MDAFVLLIALQSFKQSHSPADLNAHGRVEPRPVRGHSGVHAGVRGATPRHAPGGHTSQHGG